MMRHTTRHLADIQPRRLRPAPVEWPAIAVLCILALILGAPFIADLFWWLITK